MFWRILLSVTFFLCLAAQATLSPSFPSSGNPLPEYRDEEHIWWYGRASFKGQIIAPACTLVMEDTWQEIDMGTTPLKDLHNRSVGPEKKFRLRLRNCGIQGSRIYTGSRIHITFDGEQGETWDKFALTGDVEGINFQIMNNYRYPAILGKNMPPLLLKGNEDGLDYIFRIVRNGYPLRMGDYYAVLRFKVFYE
ncbi:TPA: type 1 fimbrial protein [Escherichia coli]|nr:type 1 fimbrial protein [Escherichia coli]